MRYLESTTVDDIGISNLFDCLNKKAMEPGKSTTPTDTIFIWPSRNPHEIEAPVERTFQNLHKLLILVTTIHCISGRPCSHKPSSLFSNSLFTTCSGTSAMRHGRQPNFLWPTAPSSPLQAPVPDAFPPCNAININTSAFCIQQATNGSRFWLHPGRVNMHM